MIIIILKVMLVLVFLKIWLWENVDQKLNDFVFVELINRSATATTTTQLSIILYQSSTYYILHT